MRRCEERLSGSIYMLSVRLPASYVDYAEFLVVCLQG